MLAQAWAATSDCPLLRPVWPLALLWDADVRTLYHQLMIWPHGKKTKQSWRWSLNLQDQHAHVCRCLSRCWLMLMKYLFIGETLLCEYLQQWRCVAVSPLEHFSDYRQKVPDALRLASSQRSQQTCPLGSSRRLRGRQVHGVYITVNAINKYSTRATVIYGL